MICLYSSPERIVRVKDQLDTAGITSRILNKGKILTVFSGLPEITQEEACVVLGLDGQNKTYGDGREK